MISSPPPRTANRPRAPQSGVLSRHPEPGEGSAPRGVVVPQSDPGGTVLNPSVHSLNLIRLLCAIAVIVSDAWWVGGYGPQPAFCGIKLGTAGILGFFAISGYLTTVSAKRSPSFRSFAAARFLPFYAGLVVAALAVAFLAAPTGAFLTGGQYGLRGALTFVGAALFLVNGVTTTPSIGTSLRGNADYLDWNGLLWPATWEVLCCAIVAVIMFLLRRHSAERHAPMLTALLLTATTAIDSSQIFAKGFEPDRTAFVLPFIAFFLAGSLLAHYRKRTRLELLPAMLAAALALAFLITDLGPILTALPFTYLILFAGSVRSLTRIRLGHDISFGLYIYGWPIQQLLVALHLPAILPPLGFAALALLSVWPVAFLSCILVEQPAKRWRRSPRGHRKAQVELATVR